MFSYPSALLLVLLCLGAQKNHLIFERKIDRNFALNGTQGEVGVSLKIFFFRETHFLL